MYQEKLFEKIKEKLNGKSLNEVLSGVLNISYDAAHRRTSLKSKMSLNESVIAAKYFGLSIDSLIGEVHKSYVSVEKTIQIKNEKNLEQYFEDSYESLRLIVDRKDFHLFYSAKDLPIFHLLKGDLLSRFKIYVWLKLLDKSFRNLPFKAFHPKLSTMQKAKKLGSIYQGVNVSEIWDTTTINSTLKQIHFYYKAGQVSFSIALELCNELKLLLDELSEKVVSKKNVFNLYYNELLLMNNNVFVFNKEKQMLFVPNSMLSYFKTTDKETCYEAQSYFRKQIKHSKLLNTSGEKEQNQFYNKMMEKVNVLIKLIEAENFLDFE